MSRRRLNTTYVSHNTLALQSPRHLPVDICGQHAAHAHAHLSPLPTRTALAPGPFTHYNQHRSSTTITNTRNKHYYPRF
ncbi:hypothetical protein E2C01_089949 [Portunus trituberculatus]|uniref:Uncharacterized protein n=1 Tax=Portunus trituberculatus TaxID=210409 RepID=A0A5B7JJL7_PORTR|nr:hypothetical protein [Portunus trituberculatus]